MKKTHQRNRLNIFSCILVLFLAMLIFRLGDLGSEKCIGDNYILLYFGKNNSNSLCLTPQLKPVNLPVTVFSAKSSDESLILIQYINSALEGLISGPVKADPELMPTIPSTTKINSVIVNGDTAYVDFSKEIVDDFWGGADNEKAAIYSIVNTVTQFSPIEQVQISIEGSTDNSIGGHYMLDRTFKRDNSLIQ